MYGYEMLKSNRIIAVTSAFNNVDSTITSFTWQI